MATTNNKIRTSELDFDQIKENLKEYMRGQSEFSDYDFEGSGLSILLDVLAYNTHYNALYTNLAINEAFLDSASKRSSVVSKAKELGYVPASARSSTAIVTIVAINNAVSAPATIEIGEYTPFTTIVDGRTYTFYTTSRYTASKNGNQYIFQNVVLKEGTPLRYAFEVVDPLAPYTLPNVNVDTSSLRVNVQENSQSTTSEAFIFSDKILAVGPEDPVYFLRETDQQLIQLEFGNGVVGKSLTAGNVITVDYMACNQDLPNGARTFTLAGNLPGSTQVFVTTSTPAFGGSASESIDSIKWNAPRAYAAQNRCVTIDDYRAVVQRLYADARSVNVWGGEQAVPPQFGKVFISIITDTGELLSELEKDNIIETIINPRKPLSITAELVDPAALDILLKVSVYVNSQLTSKTFGEIDSIVRNEIDGYNQTNLNLFGGVFKKSQLSRLIDEADSGITSNTIRTLLRRNLTPLFNTNARYEVVLGNPILKTPTADESVLTTGFTVTGVERPCFVDDVPDTLTTGKLRLFYRNPQTNDKVLVRYVGTVNYSTGQVVIDNLNITGLLGATFDMFIVPDTEDIVSIQNQFVRIDQASLLLDVLADRQPDEYSFTPVKY